VDWFFTIAALLVALLAWSRARRTAKRLEQISQMYWELRYQHGELRMQVQRMTGSGAPSTPLPATPSPPSEAFVPLASLKR
jgi:hypothetical protein